MDHHRLWLAEAEQAQQEQWLANAERRVRTMEEKIWQKSGSGGNGGIQFERWTLSIRGFGRGPDVIFDGGYVYVTGIGMPSVIVNVFIGNMLIDTGTTDYDGNVTLTVPTWVSGRTRLLGTPSEYRDGPGGFNIIATGYDTSTVVSFSGAYRYNVASKLALITLPGAYGIGGTPVAPLAGFYDIGDFAYPYKATIVSTDSVFGVCPVSIIPGPYLTSAPNISVNYAACAGQACSAVTGVSYGITYLGSHYGLGAGNTGVYVNYSSTTANRCPAGVPLPPPLVYQVRSVFLGIATVVQGPVLDCTITGYGSDPNGPYLYCGSTPTITLSGGA